MNWTDDELNYWGRTPEEQEAYDRQSKQELAQESAELDALGLWDENGEADGDRHSGQEFVDTHENIDDHPRAMAFGQFLGWTGDADVAHELALGDRAALNRVNEDVQQTAASIFDRLEKMNYWGESDEQTS